MKKLSDGFAAPLLIALTAMILGGAVFFYFLLNPKTSEQKSVTQQQVSQQPAKATPIARAKANSSNSPSPKLSESLEVDLKAAGFSVQPTNLSSVDVGELSKLYGPSESERNVKGNFYQQLFQNNNPTNPRDKLFDQLSKAGWAEQVESVGGQLNGMQADGACGGIWSMIKVEGDEMRVVAISFSFNPCLGNNMDGMPVGKNYKIFVSDITSLTSLGIKSSN